LQAFALTFDNFNHAGAFTAEGELSAICAFLVFSLAFRGLFSPYRRRHIHARTFRLTSLLVYFLDKFVPFVRHIETLRASSEIFRFWVLSLEDERDY
jgi:hypothetical protein